MCHWRPGELVWPGSKGLELEETIETIFSLWDFEEQRGREIGNGKTEI